MVSEIEFKFISSWTYDKDLAWNFTEGGQNKVIEIKVNPSDIFIDTTYMDQSFISNVCGGFPDEKEVILNPGKYQTKEIYIRLHTI